MKKEIRMYDVVQNDHTGTKSETNDDGKLTANNAQQFFNSTFHNT